MFRRHHHFHQRCHVRVATMLEESLTFSTVTTNRGRKISHRVTGRMGRSVKIANTYCCNLVATLVKVANVDLQLCCNFTKVANRHLQLCCHWQQSCKCSFATSLPLFSKLQILVKNSFFLYEKQPRNIQKTALKTALKWWKTALKTAYFLALKKRARQIFLPQHRINLAPQFSKIVCF